MKSYPEPPPAQAPGARAFPVREWRVIQPTDDPELLHWLPGEYFSKEAYERLERELAEVRTALRFDVDTNSATGWMVKYTRQLEMNETAKKNIKHLFACEKVYREQLTQARAELAAFHKEHAEDWKRVQDAERKSAGLVEALEFYADVKNWHSTHGNGGGVDNTISDDCGSGWAAGHRAREALKKFGGEK